MIQHDYCLISQIPELDMLWYTLENVRRKLVGKGVPHHVPKLNWHITHVTPFEATPVEVTWFSLGLAVGTALFSHVSPKRLVRTTCFDFYENEKELVLILRLEIDEDFRTMISKTRSIIQHLTKVKFPPKSFQPNFHATIAEGLPLWSFKQREEFLEKLKREQSVATVTNLQLPNIFMKGDGHWIPVVT